MLYCSSMADLWPRVCVEGSGGGSSCCCSDKKKNQSEPQNGQEYFLLSCCCLFIFAPSLLVNLWKTQTLSAAHTHTHPHTQADLNSGALSSGFITHSASISFGTLLLLNLPPSVCRPLHPPPVFHLLFHRPSVCLRVRQTSAARWILCRLLTHLFWPGCHE